MYVAEMRDSMTMQFPYNLFDITLSEYSMKFKEIIFVLKPFITYLIIVVVQNFSNDRVKYCIHVNEKAF